ncbi:MAG: Mur ligase family protein [Treponema sp.]
MCTKNYSKSIIRCLPQEELIAVYGDDAVIHSLSYDSRTVAAGAAFFALPGIHTDGSRFIDTAINAGAAAVIHEQPLAAYCAGICYLQVKNIRIAMAEIAAAFFEYPSKNMIIIGVTGTEGKTSTVSFIYQLLRQIGKKAGFFSTVAYCYGQEIIANPAHQTTPESITVQERLAAMRDNGCTHAVVEASSHGLSPKTARLHQVYFDAAVCMNVTQEHLEFHKTFEQYRHDKANLFRLLDTHPHIKTIGGAVCAAGTAIAEESALAANTACSVQPFAVVNMQDFSAGYFARQTKYPVYGFSAECCAAGNSGSGAADYTVDVTMADTALEAAIGEENRYAGIVSAADPVESEQGLSFTFCYPENGIMQKKEAAAPVSGLFNIYNLTAAVLTVHQCTGASYPELLSALSALQPVCGRMSRVQAGQPFEVLIDYAHTPASFQMILPAIYKRTQEKGGGVIAVFGSGGERDTAKRPEQGRIAALYCSRIILTDEDPRGEDSMAILEMIAAGCPEKERNKDVFLIPNRGKAIRKAFSLAEKNDTVLLLGKGHENSIIYQNHTMQYDEYTEALTALKGDQ